MLEKSLLFFFILYPLKLILLHLMKNQKMNQKIMMIIMMMIGATITKYINVYMPFNIYHVTYSS